MAFGPYLSYMSFGHMLQGGDIAWQGIEIWTKIAGLAGANSLFLKELEPKSFFGGRSQGETGLHPKNRVG